MNHEKSFKKDLSSLDNIFAFLSRFLQLEKLPDTEAFSIQLAVEEIFANMVKYNTQSSSDITMDIRQSGNNLIIRVTDYNVRRFDITKVEAPEVNASLRKRRVGGLGLHLAKKVIDRIEYQYENHNSMVTLTKILEP